MSQVGGARAEWEHRFRRPLWGRDEVTDHLLHLIDHGDHRVITLVGDGGVGKSHVAAVVARRASDAGRRVVLVDLTGIADAGRVLDRCAEAAGGRAPGGDALAWLVATLADEPVLLVLDCADQVARGLAAPLGDLVDACPNMVVLVTSRLPLRLSAERVVKLDPLPRVGANTPSDLDDLAGAPAVAVFVHAAEVAGRRLRRHDLASVASICDTLDGWPLAIELVASHTEVPLAALLEQLGRDGSGSILRTRAADVPARHTSIAHTVAWSVQLLDEAQRRTLALFGTMRSWATFDELLELAVSSGRARADALDDVDTLLRLHLLSVDDHGHGEVWRVRDLVRDALELVPTDDQWACLDRHLVEFATTTIAAERSFGPIVWVRALARRETDLDAALERAIHRRDGEAAAALADALASVWVRSGRLRLGEHTSRRLADTPWQVPMSPARAAVAEAWALLFRIVCSTSQARRSAAGRGFDAIVDAAVAAGDPVAIFTVCELSVEAGRRSHHFESLVRHCRIALELALERGEVRAAAAHGTWLAMAYHVTGAPHEAAISGFEALAAARAAESPTIAAYASMLLAQLPRRVVHEFGTPPTMEQVVELARAADDPFVLADVVPAAAAAALVRGDVDAAVRHTAEAVDVVRTSALYDQGLPALLVLTAVAVVRGDDVEAAGIGGAVADQLAMLRGAVGDRVVDAHLAGLEVARGRLGPAAFDRHAARGTALAWTDVYRSAAELAASWIEHEAGERPGATLTEREREVLQLLATGMSNKQIGRELGITAKTTTHHTTAIYRKLGVRTRTEAVNTAFRHGLVTDT